MMLEAGDIPKTATNILAANQVLYGENGIFGMIHRVKQSLPPAQRSKVTEKENELLENLEDRRSLVYGMEAVRSTLSDAVHEVEETGTISAMDIQALKYVNAGMPIAMRAVEEDVFRIPLVIGEEVSVMRVSVLRNGENAGEIRANMDTPKYGKLEAFIRVAEQQAEGYIVTEEEGGQTLLEQNELTVRSVLARIGLEARDLRLDGSRPLEYQEATGEEVSTAKLYRVAKQLLTAIKLTGVAADN